MTEASGGRLSPAVSWRTALATVMSFASVFTCAVQASAQVLEVGTTGDVVTYDRPAVFDGVGSAPIVLPRLPGATWRPSHPALVIEAARASEVGEDLIAAVAWSESRMRAGVVSRAGARGEMQLMPSTARALGVNVSDSRENYRGGAAYLHRLLIRYDGDLVKALAAYNAGPGAVDRYGGVPPYPETRAYVAAVLERLSREAETTK